MLNKSAVCLLLWAAASASIAHAATDVQVKPGASAYLQDPRNIVVRSSSGLCWRAGYWSSVDSVAGCDGELVPPVSKITAPAIVSPAAPTSIAPFVAQIVAPAPVKRCDFAVTLDSDQVFSFGKSTLTKAARGWIDGTLLGKLRGCNKIELITITGHADRLGSDQFNQTLSERRAEAVAGYLKNSGVSAQIDTFGAGKKQPIKNCDGEPDTRKLINCLAPNRRVVIQVRGIEK